MFGKSSSAADKFVMARGRAVGNIKKIAAPAAGAGKAKGTHNMMAKAPAAPVAKVSMGMQSSMGNMAGRHSKGKSKASM